MALAAYAGAALSGSDPMKTSGEAFRLGLAAFIVPFMFIFEPSLLMIGSWTVILQSFVSASIGTICLAAGLFGYLFRDARPWERVFLIGAAVMLIKPGLVTDLIGAGLMLSVAFSQIILRKSEPPPVLERPVPHL